MDTTKVAYIGGIVRIATSLIGGYLTQKGWSSEADVEGIAGAIVLALTGIWSIWAKRKALQAVPAATKAALALIACSVLLSGCAVINGRAGESRYTGFALGEKASSTLAGLNITETQTAKGQIVTERGVGIDQSGVSGEADVGKMLGNLLLLGLQSQGVPAASAAPSAAGAIQAAVYPAGTVYPSGASASTPQKPLASASTPLNPPAAGAIADKTAEARRDGKPLVVVAGSPACGYCTAFAPLLAASQLPTRADIILYDETAEWSANEALRWTGGGNAPIVRVTRWTAGGAKTLYDTKLERPTVAEVEAAVAAAIAL